jgi:hypothetical protein
MGVAAGGLFLYKNYLLNQKQVLSSSLEKVRASFEKETIDELDLYDKRVKASKQVLAGHIVMSPMFELLGSLTIPSIQYTKFDHQRTDTGFVVKMSGLARNYRSIALQADVFNSAKGRSFRNVIFSNLTKDKSGNVGFDVEFMVDPSLLSYERTTTLQQAQSNQVMQDVPATNTSPVVPSEPQGDTTAQQPTTINTTQ